MRVAFYENVAPTTERYGVPTETHRENSDSSEEASIPRGTAFPSTCWSQLVESDRREPAARLATLARDYWRPVVAYLRASQRTDYETALDLAQSFFAHVIESDWLDQADPSRGRFRGFLKQSLVNFALDVRRSERALRRGGSQRFVPLASPDDDNSREPTDPGALAPEAALDRQWRRELVERAIADARTELEATGRGTQYAAFAAYFLADDATIDYRAIGERLSLSPAEVSNALQRCKRLFREKLKARVIETVASEDDLEVEWKWLFGSGRVS